LGGFNINELITGFGNMLAGGPTPTGGAFDLINGLVGAIDIEKMIASLDMDIIMKGPLGNMATTVMNKVTTNPVIIKSVGNIMTAFMASQKAMKVEITAGKVRPGVSKRMKIVYGPYVLKAANVCKPNHIVSVANDVLGIRIGGQFIVSGSQRNRLRI
jgi:hypothetical protein